MPSPPVNRLSLFATFVIICISFAGCAVSVPLNYVGTDCEADWLTRSTGPGVTITHHFDKPDEVTRYRLGDSLEDHVVWETGFKKSGAGSLRINVLKRDHANSGSWRRFLKPDGSSFGPGEEFYVQYRVYITKAMVDARKHTDGGGWKTSIISRADDLYPGSVGSNWYFEIVVNNQNYRGYVYGYNRGSPDYQGWEQWRRVRWPVDDWLTILQHVRVGTLRDGHYKATQVRTWAAHDVGGYKLLVDHKRDVAQERGQPSTDDVYNGIWFLPYDTGRAGSKVDTFILFDELIVSENFIAAPACHKGYPQ